MTEFDLPETMRTVMADRDEWDLDSLVEQVYKATPARQLRDAYRAALRGFITRELTRFSQNSRPDQNGSDTQQRPAGPGANFDRSRSALIRAGFRQQINVGDNTWKAIEQCTAADLMYAAAVCDRMAEFNAARAQQYRTLVKVMTEHDAERVADLPAEIVEKVLTDDDH